MAAGGATAPNILKVTDTEARISAGAAVTQRGVEQGSPTGDENMSVILYSRETWGVCKCGHYDWQHSDFVHGGEDGHDIIPRAEGHGKCAHGANSDEPCPCPQFTWVKSIPHQTGR